MKIKMKQNRNSKMDFCCKKLFYFIQYLIIYLYFSTYMNATTIRFLGHHFEYR